MKVADLVTQLKAKNRLALARAITLVESENEKDQLEADQLLESLKDVKTESFRIGISGSPGVGKSTLIETLGLEFIKLGYHVAVLAIDPSSDISQGSILGDKTRMEDLSRKEEAFIRPSPSRGFLGGIGIATRDAIRLCEVAGHDIVIVETVGVGQSESLAAQLVDYFVYVSIPGAGDDLQGIKKGVLERTDAVVINKVDGQNKVAAQIAQKQYQSSLKILRAADIPVYLVSALQKTGMVELAQHFKKVWGDHKMEILSRRQTQENFWVRIYLDYFLKLKVDGALRSHPQSPTLSNESSARKQARHLLTTLKF